MHMLILLVLALQLPKPEPVLPKPQAVVVVAGPERKVTSDLKEATDDLCAWLDSSVQDDNTIKRDGWYRYLKLNRLKKQIADGTVSIADIEETKRRLERSYPALELPPFERFRKELDIWLNSSIQPLSNPSRRGWRMIRNGST